jgi:hypothetical protein
LIEILKSAFIKVMVRQGLAKVRRAQPRARSLYNHRSMKAFSAFGLLLALAVMGGCTGPVQRAVAHRDYGTDLDLTTATDFEASGLAGEQHLRTFRTNIVQGSSDDYIFGEYRSPMDVTGGHNLHLFPDGCFVIEETCDIGRPVTLASGRWKLDGDTLLIFDLLERRPASALLGMQWLREQFGSPHKLRVFVTANGEWIGDTILVAEDTANKGPHVGWKYVRRITHYADWPQWERELLKQ